MLAYLAAILTITGLANGIGIGAGHYVTVREGNALVAYGTTDDLSSVTLVVDEGIVDVQIHLPGTWFYAWLCRDQFVPVDQEQEYVTIACVRKWQLALPHLGKLL